MELRPRCYEDWVEKSLDELGVFIKGKGVSRSQANSGSIPCVRYGEIYTQHNDIIKKFYSFISREVAKEAVQLKTGDILFTCSGETKEEIGKSVAFTANLEAYAGGDIILLRGTSADAAFLGYRLNAKDVVLQKSSAGQGDAVVHINATALGNIQVTLPRDIAEQKAIAAALSDVDALLSSLDALITKKRDMKKAAMQELLTGKTRLPGFGADKGYVQTEVGIIPEDWEIEYIENIAEITTGAKNNQDKISDGRYPFFVRSQVVERINSFSFDGEAVLTAGDGAVGKIFHYINGKFDVHQRVYQISKFSEKVSGYFFYLYFSKNFYERIMQMTAKSTVDSVRREMIAEMKVALPSVAEQQAIAAVLSDMDAELEALEARYAKVKDMKTGMMQELLTGKTRLVSTGEQHG